MDIDGIITKLQEAQGAARALDSGIATVLGWRVTSESYIDPATRERRERRVWLMPRSDKIGVVPQYTSSLHVAHLLVMDIAPGIKSGASWEPGMASAKIGDGPLVEAATPAIAICLASMIALGDKGKLGVAL